MPVNLLPCSSRGDSNASWADTNGRWLVIVGTPNHSAGIAMNPAYTIHRISGIFHQHHRPYRPTNGHTSGRPSEPSTSSQNAHRGRRERWQSIAARHRLTIIGSDCTLRMSCMYWSMPSSATAANSAAAIAGQRLSPSLVPVSL